MEDAALSLIWYVLFLPLLGAVVQALFGKAAIDRLGAAKGKKLMGYLAVLPIAVAFLIGVGITLNLSQRGATPDTVPILSLFDWFTLYSLRVPFEVRPDHLAMTMVLVITGVGALIHLYATGYMAADRDYTRFFTYLNLFIACMLILVLGNNLALMFIGWEGVGLCSYLLIGYWYKDVSNAKAANKAFIVNRIGDWGMMLGIFLLFAMMVGGYGHTGIKSDPRWLSFDVLLPRIGEVFALYPEVGTAAALLLFVGAMGKSAQFPLYVWLPDAMAGPTPVSALIHAATMVTAGVFMLNRLHPVFLSSPVAMGIVACVGAFTAVFAALVAFGQTDIKKVLAYSTVSQLGFMFVACGVGAFWAGMFHVVTHAFFKALLFLGSGAVIYAMAHEQDMRRFGNLFKYLRITGITMIVGWLAISGVVPLAGFFSKESILGGALGNGVAMWGDTNVGVIAGWVLLGVAGLTAAYMTRMTLLTFGFPTAAGRRERWRTAEFDLPGHPDHAHDVHHAHEGHQAHDDPHSFFLSDEETKLRAQAGPEHHASLEAQHQPKEVPPSMWMPLVALAALSIAGGLLLNGPLKGWLYPLGMPGVDEALVGGHPHGWVGQWLVAMSLAAAGLGILYGVVVYRRGLPKRENAVEGWSPFRRASGAQFGFDDLVVQAGVEGGGNVAGFLWKRFDAGFVDGFVNGIALAAGRIGDLLRLFQTGFVRSYALIMLAGGVALLAGLWYAATRGPGGAL